MDTYTNGYSAYPFEFYFTITYNNYSSFKYNFHH